MDPLDRHRQRVERMRAALERLLALHTEIHDLQGEIVALSRTELPDREDRVKALHAKVRELLPGVERAQRALAGDEGGRDEDSRHEGG